MWCKELSTFESFVVVLVFIVGGWKPLVSFPMTKLRGYFEYLPWCTTFLSQQYLTLSKRRSTIEHSFTRYFWFLLSTAGPKSSYPFLCDRGNNVVLSVKNQTRKPTHHQMDVRVEDLYCRRRVRQNGTSASHNCDGITCGPVRYASKAFIVRPVFEFDSIARPSELQRLITIRTSFRCS